MEVLARMKQLMEERGWSAYRLAREAGLPPSAVNNLFRRNNSPTVPTIERYCKAFGISLAQFFTNEQEAVVLSSEQRDLLARYALLNEAQRGYLDVVLNGMLTK